MGSVEAMQAGSKDRYFQNDQTGFVEVRARGIVARVPYKGVLGETVYQLIGGLPFRHGVLRRQGHRDAARRQVVRITSAAVIEKPSARRATITKEAPNYSPGN